MIFSHAPLPTSLAPLHKWVRRQPWLARFTLLSRVLLAMAFLSTGLVKVAGQRFTLMPVDTPIGFFFEAMYQTGPFWYFIGFVQVAAALLLLIPSTTLVGALICLPISFSILLITWGVGFGNTVFVAAGMTLSAAYLVCWDGDRVWSSARTILGRNPGPAPLEGASILERAGWLIGSTAGLALFLGTRGFVPMGWGPSLLILAVGAALMVVSAWIIEFVRGASDRSHELTPTSHSTES